MSTSECSARCRKNCCSADGELTPKGNRRFTIALLGQPNTGKSTIFNKLTGANQHVGNWPGKTVEKKEGYFFHDGRQCFVYDLPGTYSLTANSLEELIARDFILNEAPDLVVVVIDAAQLKRSLYMLAEAVLLGASVLVALNKMDLVDPDATAMLPEKIHTATGVPVIPLAAVDKKHTEPLVKAIFKAADQKGEVYSRPDAAGHFGPAFHQVLNNVNGYCPDGYLPEWITLKLLEDDDSILDLMRSRIGELPWKTIEETLSPLEKGVVKGGVMRYAWIEDILAAAESGGGRNAALNRFDAWATHPLWGNLIALGAFVVGILCAYLIAIPMMIPGIGLFFASYPLRGIMEPCCPIWLSSLLADGLLCGVAMGVTIFGFIGAVLFVLGVFENTGYLARVAYLFDPFMKRIGLHGKSIMPLLMGIICNILGVAGTRVIDTWQQRLATLVLVPIVPCKGLFMVIAFVSAIFFGPKALLVFALLTVVTLLYISLTSLGLRRFFIKGDRSGMIMELPPYHKPIWRDIMAYSLSRMKAFYRRGFWFIVFVSFVCWAGTYYPGGSINSSYLAAVGRFFEPVGALMGLDWRLFISYLVAFTSKEATLGAMVVIFGAGAAASGATNVNTMAMDKALWGAVHGKFDAFLASTGISSASALAFVFAVTFSLPCLGTLAMIYAETRSLKWTGSALCYYFIISILMGAMAYQAGLLIF
jgi:ferrous iron transport protein B